VAGLARAEDEGSLATLSALSSTIGAICSTLRGLKTEAPNHFGAFRVDLQLSAARNLTDRLLLLLDEAASPSDDMEYLLADAEAMVTDVLAKVFWLKYMGREVVEASWERLAHGFEAEFGPQRPHLMAKLRRVLDVDGTGSVSVATFERVTLQHGGLYQAYQATCDPVTVVYEMGTVEDNSATAVLRPTLVQGLLGLSIRQICCGGQHAAVLVASGEVYTWGKGGFGRLGHGDTVTLPHPRLVEALRGTECCQVACGFAYTAAVTSSGHLYTWGAGENGRLGLGEAEDRNVPSHVEELMYTPVKHVFAGSVHTCVLTRAGTVYSFGKHEYTGHGSGEDVLLPRLLDAFDDKRIDQISVGPGGYHTIALTVDKEVYTWGHNRVGQLGYSNSSVVPRNVEGAHFLPTPKAVASLRNLCVSQVVAGWGHSAVLTTTGEVYICGRNFQGQLGLGDPSEFPRNERNHPFQANFLAVDSLRGKRVIQIACGGEHSVALSDTGEVFTFGAGTKGQLGHGVATNEHFPRLLKELRRTRRNVSQVACGNNCTLILANHFEPPSLLDRCCEVIRSTPAVMAHLDGLPSDLVNRIQSTAVLEDALGALET